MLEGGCPRRQAHLCVPRAAPGDQGTAARGTSSHPWGHRTASGQQLREAGRALVHVGQRDCAFLTDRPVRLGLERWTLMVREDQRGEGLRLAHRPGPVMLASPLLRLRWFELRPQPIQAVTRVFAGSPSRATRNRPVPGRAVSLGMSPSHFPGLAQRHLGIIARVSPSHRPRPGHLEGIRANPLCDGTHLAHTQGHPSHRRRPSALV